MGYHDALTGSIAVPALLPAVFYDEKLILIQVAGNAQRLVGFGILLVKHRQGVIGARLRRDIVYPTHEYLLIGRIARRCEAVIIVAAQTHDVPIAQAIMIAVARVVEVRQSQAVAELMGKRSDTVDGRAVVIAAMQLVEHRKVIDQRITRIGPEGTVATHSIVGGRTEVPVAGPYSLGVCIAGLCLTHTGINDYDHITVVIAIGIIGCERHAVGSRLLTSLGHQVAQALVVAALIATIIGTVLRQRVDTINVKLRLIQAVGLVTEVLSHALIAREHGIDNILACIIELFVLELNKNDGNFALSQ